jgi:hypothetical protein
MGKALAAQNKLFSGVLDNFAGKGFTSGGHNLSDNSSGAFFLSASLGDLFGSTIKAGLSTTLSTNQNGHAWLKTPSDIGSY